MVFIFLWIVGSFAQSQEIAVQHEVEGRPEIVINMESYAYTPSEITIEKNVPVKIVLRNQSFLVPHNFLLDDPHGIRVLDVDISSGETEMRILTLRESGRYLFYCDKQLFFFPSHREEGMEGHIVVP